MATKRERDTVATTRALRERFAEAHAEGMAALKRRDYDAVNAALRDEEQIIHEQERLIEDRRVRLRAHYQRLLAARYRGK